MQRRLIQRGGIRSAGYDAHLRILDIEFDTRRILRYENVGFEVADRFLTNAHPASYWHDQIEEDYSCHEVTEEESRKAGRSNASQAKDNLKRLFGDL